MSPSSCPHPVEPSVPVKSLFDHISYNVKVKLAPCI